LNKYNINILNYMSISIDISNAGQCHMMAIEKYKTYNEGTVLVASIQLMDKENNQLTLKNRSDITDATHTILLHIPDNNTDTWIVIDPTYTSGALCNFKNYIKSLEKVYESGTDWVRISWMKTAYINKWIPKSGERQLDWNHFSN
jgi:hypothetical protein